MHNTVQKSIPFLILLFTLTGSISAKTRWSTFHSIPDADLLEGGSLLWNLSGYHLLNTESESGKTKPSGMLTLGVIEWVNISGGYTGGPAFGMKVRILGETKEWMPSVALGVRNIFTNQDSYYFDHDPDSLTSEIYCAFGKGIENLRLRMNLGVMSVPADKNDIVNFFVGVEKYFGKGLYLSLELFRRQKEFVTSIFVDWRIAKRRIEFYGGVIDITGLVKKDKKLTEFAQPGINAGVRILLNVRRGKSDGFTTLEDQLRAQNKTIKTLKNDIDSIKTLLNKGTKRIEGLTESFYELTNDSTSEVQSYRLTTLEKLAALKNLYEQEPFEPDLVKNAQKELVVHRDKIVPVLIEVALSKKEDTRIRTLATSMCGEIKSAASADALIEILSQVHIPEIKIEALIALGKLKEVRAVFLMQQLASDPNDAVAFTAMEVLQKLEKETGITSLSVNKNVIPENSIPENKIGVRTPGGKGLVEIIDETSRTDSEMKLQKIEKRSFSESIVDNVTADSLIDTLQEKTTTLFSAEVQIDTTDATDTIHSDTLKTVKENSPVVGSQVSDSSGAIIKKNKKDESGSLIENKAAALEKEDRKSSKKNNKKEKKKEDEKGSW
ncbi:MAG: HEAT repeat domain-containing protein [Chitinispirillaceae bacterium]|nr:HEAT repeat domain-containing protein [Chitinispirillaceae bacterium]